MDLLDFNIKGEIFIPLENSNFLNGKSDITYKDLYETSYTDYRNVLFQGEIIKFYIVLKSDDPEKEKAKSLLDKLFLKIEYESADINEEDDENDADAQKEKLMNSMNDLFSIDTDKLNEKDYEYEKINRKYYDEEANLEFYELFKQISVPSDILDKNCLIKLQLMIKSENESGSKKHKLTALDYFNSGFIVNTNKYKILKTLFKEIKVIRPLTISETKQTNLTLDTSLLQKKIENSTADINFVDNSLSNSKFLKNEKNLDITEKKGFDITINEIAILQEETSINESKTNEDAKDFFKKKCQMNDLNFVLLDKNMPKIIHPGEEYIITLKVTKNSFIKENPIILNENTLIEQDEETENLNIDDIEGNLNINQLTSSTNSKENTVNETESSSLRNSFRKRINSNANTGFTDFKRKTLTFRLNTTSNQSSRLSTASINITTFGNNPIYSSSGLAIIEEGNRQITLGNVKNTQTEFDDFNDEVLIELTTPVTLYLSGSLFYENLFMCLRYEWNKDFNRFLKMEVKIPDNVYINESFDMILKIKNIYSLPMNLYIEIKDNDDFERINYIPPIISQTKFQIVGTFNSGEDKVLNLGFTAVKLGFAKLPNFAIEDSFSNKRFYIVHSNRVFVKKKNDLNEDKANLNSDKNEVITENNNDKNEVITENNNDKNEINNENNNDKNEISTENNNDKNEINTENNNDKNEVAVSE